MPKEFRLLASKPLLRLTAVLAGLCVASPVLPADVEATDTDVARTSVRKGDTLDRLLARHLKDHPFRVEVLRRLVVQKNPQAFRAGRADQLIAGASINWPNQQELQALLPPAPGEPATGTEGTDSEVIQSADPRAGWIRYP
jgi:Tfp pilus assembly protein FimV